MKYNIEYRYLLQLLINKNTLFIFAICRHFNIVFYFNEDIMCSKLKTNYKLYCKSAYNFNSNQQTQYLKYMGDIGFFCFYGGQTIIQIINIIFNIYFLYRIKAKRLESPLYAFLLYYSLFILRNILYFFHHNNM